MTTRFRCLIVAIALLVPLIHGTATAAAPQLPYPVIGRVVDGNGRVQRPSNLVACPIVGTTFDCTHKIVEPTGPLGVAVLKLNKAVRYHLFATVTNPNPAWVCPGLKVGADMVYLSNESFDGLPSQLPQLAKFTIVKPRAGDCARVTVTDDAGNPLPGAGLFVDDGFSPLADATGGVSINVTAGASYEIRAYLANSGWPCPSNTQPDGSTYHFSEPRTVTTEQLLTGTVTFAIHHPTPYDCVNVKITDDAGNPVPNAGLFIDDGFSSQSDANGNIQLAVTPGTSYQIGAFVGNTGWPCPQFTSPDGTTFHFAATRTVTAEELVAGQTTFVIVKPRPDDCALVKITDDAGNPLPGAGVSINGLGGSGPANANGIVQIKVTAGATYEIGAFLANSGWPCPAQILLDGTTQHRSETRTLTTEQLLAGQTFVIHHPTSDAECPPPISVPVFDDLGNQVPGATGAFFCRVENGGCTALPFVPRDPSGTGSLLFDINTLDPAATYRIQPFVIDSGWPCAFILDNGHGFHSGPNVDVTGANLIAGNLTLMLHHPTETECPPPPPSVSVPVFDDLGNQVPGATGAFFCRVENGDCTTLPFVPHDPDGNGNLLFDINTLDPAATYRIQPFVIDSGWPCAFILDNGHGFHSGPNVDVTGANLIAGNLTLILHHPTDAECP